MSVAQFTPQYTSPFDIASITKSIDSAMNTLKPEEHGAVVVQVNNTGAAATLVAKGPQFGPFKSSFLGTITKPMAGPIGWNVSGRVSFAVGELESIPSYAILRGWYRVMRIYNNPIKASIKAMLLCFGSEVKLLS